MSTKLRSLVDQMRRDVVSPHHQSTFRAARERRPAFADHADLASVLRMLADDREETYPAREELTRALLAEHQAGTGTFWASALVVAYYPMLSRLRHRILGDTVARDDLDQLVLTSFAAALREVPVRIDRLALRLRQRTQRQVFRFIRRERLEQHVGYESDDLPADGLEPEAVAAPQLEQEAREGLTKLLTKVAEGELPRGSLQLILTTVLGRERLRAYVGRTVVGDERTRERVYQRLKRQRTRALKRLRKLLAESPLAEASVF